MVLLLTALGGIYSLLFTYHLFISLLRLLIAPLLCNS